MNAGTAALNLWVQGLVADSGEPGSEPPLKLPADAMAPDTYAIRQHIKSERKLLGKRQRRVASLRLFRRCLTCRDYKKAKYLGIYLSHQGEIDLEQLIKHAWRHRKHIYLPVISAGNKLTFYRYDRHTRQVKNKFNILEPTSSRQKIPSKKIDLVLAPLVAFDAHCHRIGMGGGYYDRTFSHKLNKRFLKPTLMGVAYDWQRQKNVVKQAWDVSMDWILTDKNSYR